MIERFEHKSISSVIDKELISLTQDLIKIPSWISKQDTKQNENEIVDYLESWMKNHTTMEVVRQEIGEGRFNLICKKGNPDIVFLGHTDTVAPSYEGKFDPLAAVIEDGKIWGRGSTDMKSGIAAVAQAISLSPEADNIWFMLYADEEYDFKGMKALISEYGHIQPKLIISADGSDLEIGHGCRGLIDFQAIVNGKSGHPAKGNGLNAIDGSFKIIKDLETHVRQYSHPIMGGTTLNIGNIIGGTKRQDTLSFDKDGSVCSVNKENNVIANICEFGLDIRPSSVELDFNNVNEFLEKSALNLGYTYQMIRKNHDLGAWYTDRQDLTKLGQIATDLMDDVKYANPNNTGYIDLQMFWERVGRPPSFTFGGGSGDTAHKNDEYIKISDLIMERDFFVSVIKNISK